MRRDQAEALAAVINLAPRRRPQTGAKVVGSEACGYMVIYEDHNDGYSSLQMTMWEDLTRWLLNEGYHRGGNQADKT